MKSIINLIAIITISFALQSCGKKYDYVCTTQRWDQFNGVTAPPYNASMTENQANRYEKKHRKNDDGNDMIIRSGEVQVICAKK